jgi:hypothetical protein
MKKWIEEKKYVFDINDLICLVYLLCVVGIMCGLNMTPLFFVGCVVSFVACFKAKRINLVIINLAFVVLNGYSLIQMVV